MSTSSRRQEAHPLQSTNTITNNSTQCHVCGSILAVIHGYNAFRIRGTFKCLCLKEWSEYTVLIGH